MALFKKLFKQSGKGEEKSAAAKTVLRTGDTKKGQQEWQVKSLPEWKPGDVILDTYEIEDVISGGMGHVYIANHKHWRRKLAIKSPNQYMLSNKDLFARIIREAHSWTGLGLHPNIAYCYYVRNIEDVPHIVIEYVDGGNLKDWIEDGKCIDFKANLNLALQFCHGMEYAHSKGIIHRDIKPENILMTKDGVLKITDFGLMRGGTVIQEKVGENQKGRQTVDSSLTRLGDFMGTESYISPEQAESPAEVDERTDIFSFGVCLYEMFCGNKPYDITYGPSQEAPDPVILSHDENFPKPIAEVLKKTVQWNREDRHTSFEDIRKEFSENYKELYNEESPYAELKLADVEADNLNNQGVSFMELGEKEKARHCFEKAVDINSTHPQAVYNLSLIQWRNGEIDDSEVIKKLEECKNNPSADIEMLAELMANIHMERFSPREAKEVLKDYPGKYNALFKDKEIPEKQCIRTFEGHEESVNSVAFSPDSRYALSGSDDETLKLWEVETGRCIRTFEGHESHVNSVAFSPDSKYALSGSSDNTMKLWELNTGKCVRTFVGHIIGINSVAYSPDSKYVLSGGSDKTMKLWEVETGKQIRTFNGFFTYHEGDVNSVAFSHDSRYVLSGSEDRTLKLWKVKRRFGVRSFAWHEDDVNSVAFSHDSKYALSGSSDKTMKLWEVESGKCIRTFKGHEYRVNSVAFSHDSKYALSGGSNKTMKLWEVESGRLIRTYEGHDYGVNSVAISPDSRYVLSGSHDKTLKLREINCLIDVSSYFYLSKPKGSEELEKEKQVISNAEYLFKKGDYKKAYAKVFELWSRKGFSRDKSILAIYADFMKKGRINKAIILGSRTFEGHEDSVNSVAFSPDSRYALSGSSDATMKLWEVETGRCIRTFKRHTFVNTCVNSVAFSPDSRYVLSASNNYTMKLWEVETGRCIRTFKRHKHSVNSVAFSPDSRYALSGSSDKTLKLWEVKTGRCVRTFEGHSNVVQSVAFSPDLKYVLSGSGNIYYNKDTLKLWEMETGKCVRTFEGHKDSVNSVAISPDSKFVLSGSGDFYNKGTLKLWEVETGKCVRTFEGHKDSVNSVAISPDARYVISGSHDKTLKLWEAETGRCVGTFMGHEEAVISVAISPDSRYALSAGLDNTLKLWNYVFELEFPEPAD